MPQMDFSVVLTNPMLMDTFDVTRRPDNVNNFGEANPSSTPMPGKYGVVTVASSAALQRLPDEQRNVKSIEIITKFALRGATRDGAKQDYQPDLVTWSGNNYIVADVEDWSHFGTGFINAVCTLIDSLPVPPTTL